MTEAEIWDELDNIYADFDYPFETSHLTRFSGIVEGGKKQVGNFTTTYRNLQTYLTSCAVKYFTK